MDKCTYDPRELTGEPIGMFHCPECGDMVIAGMDHPDIDEEAKKYVEYLNKEKEQMMIWLDARLEPKDFLVITESMKNVLLELWLRADINNET